MARNGSPRRRALADLPGNKDSPICGLIPSISSQSILNPLCSSSSSKIAAISCTNPATISAGYGEIVAAEIESPIGEKLLRSQVQILLNKVESEAPRDNRTSSSRFRGMASDLCLNLHSSHAISPALRLVAPTPMNTPLAGSSIPSASASSSSSITPCNPNSSQKSGLHNAFHGNVVASMDPEESLQDSGIKLFVDLAISPQTMSASRELSRFNNSEKEDEEESSEMRSVSQRGSGLMKHSPIQIAESVTSGGSHHHHHHHHQAVTPLTATHEDKARTFLGKSTTRTLRFDSPEKKTSSVGETCGDVRGLWDGACGEPLEEDDRASEWSVLVNVSSPNGKEGDNEFDDGTCWADYEPCDADGADNGPHENAVSI